MRIIDWISDVCSSVLFIRLQISGILLAVERQQNADRVAIASHTPAHKKSRGPRVEVAAFAKKRYALVVASIGPAQCGCIRTLRRCTVWWTFAFLAGGNMRIISCALALVLLAGCASTLQKRPVLVGKTVPGGTTYRKSGGSG